MAGVRRTALFAAAAACLIALVWASPARAAGWLSPADLSLPGKSGSNAAVGMSDSGEAVAIWRRSGVLDGGIYYATRSPGGNFSGPQPLAFGASGSDIAMTRGGETVVAWKRLDLTSGKQVVQAATRPPGGGFSSPVDVAEVLNGIPQGIDVAVGASGDVAVAWTETDSGTGTTVVNASVRPDGGDFSLPERVSPAPIDGQSAVSPRVGLSANGKATAIWRYDQGVDAAVDNVIQTATRPPGGSFSAPAPLSASAEGASGPALAVAPSGEAVATWITSGGADQIAQASIRSAGGPFSAPDDISAPGEDAFSPDVAISPDGQAVATWVASGASSLVRAATRQPGGSFAAPDGLSTPSPDTRSPRVGLNGGGAGIVAWQRSNGSHLILQASVRSSGGGFSTPDDVSAAGGDATPPDVGIDAAAGAVAAWSRESTVQAAGYDVQGPSVRSLSVPSSAVVGKPVSVSAGPSDDWGVASTSFNFGDGATAQGEAATHTYSEYGAYAVTVTVTDGTGASATEGRAISVFASSAFGLRKLRRLRRTGRAIVVVHVSGPGRVVLFGRGLRKIARRVSRARNVRLPVKPRRWLRRRLNRRHRARVLLRVFFSPVGGRTARKSRRITLIKRARGGRRHAGSR